jgi:hypothetical protein
MLYQLLSVEIGVVCKEVIVSYDVFQVLLWHLFVETKTMKSLDQDSSPWIGFKLELESDVL